MRRYSHPFIFILAVSSMISCAQNSHEERPTKTVSTAQPQKPIIVDEDGYRIARGATRLPEIKVSFDKDTKTMMLKGRLEYLTLEGRSLEGLQMDMVGVMDDEGFVQLRDLREAQFKVANLRLVAKATCLSEAGDCSSSFVDIYLYSEGVVYHHQIESHQEGELDQAPQGENMDREESEGGADEADSEPGQYVGTIKKDIEQLLDIKPLPHQTPETTVEEKKDEQKEKAPTAPTPEAPKVSNPKKAEPKAGVPTAGVPTKDLPKKDNPKTDPPTIVSPKKEEPKVLSQSIGAVNAGRLQNATDVLKLQKIHAPAGFTIIRPQRMTHFSAKEMAHIIMQMGLFTKSELPGQLLLVGDISRQNGGTLGSHKSHQNGLDVDVGFYFNNKNLQGSFVSAVAVDRAHPNWLVHEQWKLFKKVVNTRLIDRIFIHKTLKQALCRVAINNGEITRDTKTGLAHETLRRLIADTTHNTHFHLRVKCSSDQVRCRQMAEPAAGPGCF